MTNTQLLERIANINPDEILNRPVIPGFNEKQVVEDAIAGASTLKTIYGDVQLPGMTRFKPFLLQAVADFVKNVANNQVVNFASRVTPNNIAVESLDRPQVYSGQTDFRQTGLTVGQYLPILSQTSGTAINMVSKSERYIITDLVEFDPTAGVEGILIVADGDNNSQPLGTGVSMRTYGALRVFSLDIPQVADVSLKIAGRLVEGTDSELVPLGLRVFTGDQVRAL